MLPNLYLIDLFCGAGGVTTGFDAARHNKKQFCQVLACINHDAKAIDSHYMNHPFVKHYTEDVRQMDLTELVALVKKVRASDSNAFIVLWASLECTNFSKAKGGKTRKADSRMLADEMDRYVLGIDPDYFMIENVIEFVDWGPLRIGGTEFADHCTLDVENGEYIFVPDKSRLKEFFTRWKKRIQSYGYKFEDNDEGTLNAADYGACQSRRRYFAAFAKPDLPMVWPTRTHAKDPKKHPGLKKWEPVRKALDLNNHGPSVFIPNRIKSEKSWSRIYEGLIKHVAGGKDRFLIKYNSVNGKTGKHVVPGIDEPCPTVSVQGRIGIVTPEFLVHYRGQGKSHDLNNPSPSICTKDKLAFVNCHYLVNYHGKDRDDKSIDVASGTVTTKEDCGLITAQFLKIDHTEGQTSRSLKSPAGAVKTVTKENLITCMPFIMDTQFSNGCQSVDQPIGTLTANRKWHYIINPQWANNSTKSIDDPSHTLIARMDKAPSYLITTEEGYLAIEIFDTDSPMMQKVKEFMALYGIVDIKMRMLTIIELLRIQGFPKGYVLVGTQADQKKFIGNAVEVNQARRIAEALYASLVEYSQKRIAA